MMKLTSLGQPIADKQGLEFEVSITSLLLLRGNAHSVATVGHSVNKVRDAVAHLNPDQVPVVTVDQPIYMLLPHKSNGTGLTFMVRTKLL